ncbi:MAG TPA: two-component regulator propeller domain-containing protein [Blastocatellia bacterium]|nr:two-component regulator propeller domain-containing protein [Blastocatellia bacterium]
MADASKNAALAAYLALWLILELFLPGGARAEQLPVKTYTTADGLLRDQANQIKRDSRGFLWFCTNDGLSRFDGYRFTNYTTDDGLPHREVNDLLETRSGAIWVATGNGLARFNPKGRSNTADSIGATAASMFVAYWPEENVARRMAVLFEDAQGKLWCGTDDGLYWFEERDGRVVWRRLDLPKERPDMSLPVTAIIQDRRGTLWIGTENGQGLNRILTDGRIEHYLTKRGRNEVGYIKTLLETKDGEIWAGMSGNGGLCSLVAEPAAGRSIFSRCYTKKDGLPDAWIVALYQTVDGKVWIGTPHGAASFDPHDSSSPQFTVYGEAQGLCDEATSSLREDREGDLWVATARGVKQIARSNFVRYTERDGLASRHVDAIISSHAAELFVITKQTVERADKQGLNEAYAINHFDENRFVSVTPRMPANVSTGWGSRQIVVEDRMGQWWLPSNKKAVFRFPVVGRLEHLSSARPKAIAIPDDEVFRLYEDSRGDIWIGTMYYGRVLKWESGVQQLSDYTSELTRPGDASGAGFPMTCFAEDHQGTLWAGFYNHSYLLRRRDGHSTLLPTRGERSAGSINGLYFDHTGRLWLASAQNGVGRIDDPQAESLKIVWYNRRKGLATDSTVNLIEDDFGRIYVGHGRGVDRLTPDTGQIKHYTTADGLPPGAIHCATRDAQGALWFGGTAGLARLIPEPDKPRQVPTILLMGLRVAGERRPVSELGEESLPALTLEPSQTQVGVDFLGLGASLGEELKYQYKLEGAQNDWSEPSAQRAIDFANLAPGAYRLLVKAITAEGAASANPASFNFTILPPVWRRPWFMLLVGAAGALTLYALYRYRLSRMLELERVRTRIASDLHDDIGSNLSLIAGLSEVVGQQARRLAPQIAEQLALIAAVSHKSVDAMSDIVWMTNPKKDNLSDLTQRMRRFAGDTLIARNVELRFDASGAEADIKLGADLRREVFLIFKEAINNAARHARCSTVEVALRIEGYALKLKVSDDGCGFDASRVNDGQGLVSMGLRAKRLGGKLSVDSQPGAGATVTLNAPLD